MAGSDMAEVIRYFLKNNAAAATLRSYVQGGTDNILAAGDLTDEILSDAVDARRTAGVDNVALAISVQDAGERETGFLQNDMFVAVRVYDRYRGYKNLRKCKIELMKILVGHFANLTAGIGIGHRETFFQSRTGHRFSHQFSVDYESLTFRCAVMYGENTYNPG